MNTYEVEYVWATPNGARLFSSRWVEAVDAAAAVEIVDAAGQRRYLRVEVGGHPAITRPMPSLAERMARVI